MKLTPYRSAARPTAARPDAITIAFLLALCRALPWIGLALGVLGPLAACSPEDSRCARWVLIYGVILTGVVGAWLAGKPLNAVSYARRQLAWLFLLHSVAAFITTGMLYGLYDAVTKPLPPVRFVVPRGERIPLPHGTYVSYGSSRVKILGGAVLIMRGAAARCMPPYGPLEENVMYTPDCDREAE